MIRTFIVAVCLILALACVQPEETVEPVPDTPLSDVVDEPMCNRLTLSLESYVSGRSSQNEYQQVVKEVWYQVVKENRPDDDREYFYVQKGLDVIFEAGGEEMDKYISSLQWACVLSAKGSG